MTRFTTAARAAAATTALLVAMSGGLSASPQPQAQHFPVANGTLVPQLIPHATASNVFVAFLGHSAAFSDDVSFYYQTGNTWQFLFNNQTAAFGQTVQLLGTFNIGDPLIFKLVVTPPGGAQQKTYYTGIGDGSDNGGFANNDGKVHMYNATYSCTSPLWTGGPAVNCAPLAGFNAQIGWEDLPQTGDKDYNDLMFAVKGAMANPEPVSMLLIGTGLAGVSAVARRRRRQQVEA